MRPAEESRRFAQYCKRIATSLAGRRWTYTSIRLLPTGQGSLASHRYDEAWLGIVLNTNKAGSGLSNVKILNSGRGEG